jgi:adenine phosphoribosyltransferase
MGPQLQNWKIAGRQIPARKSANIFLSRSALISLQFGVPMEELKRLIREVPDFPKPGILFYDITTLLKDAEGFRSVIDGLRQHYQRARVDTVLGIEARGFIFAPALAYALGAGFVPVRKPNKLPAECVSVTYDLEYGSDSLEMHKDAIGEGHRVLIVDDLLATGGTAAAAARMVKKVGGSVAGIGFVVELTFLNGRQKLPGLDVFSLLQYHQ